MMKSAENLSKVYCLFRSKLFTPFFLSWYLKIYKKSTPGVPGPHFPKIPIFPKMSNFPKNPKITKNSSQNAKSRIGIRDSKFLAYSYTPASSFIFQKNHILEIPFLWILQNPNFWKFLTFWKMQNSDRPLGDPKMR